MKNDVKNNFYDATYILKQRSNQNKEAVSIILKHMNLINEYNYLSYLILSHVHMFMNRLFIAQQRKYELLVYHFLEKYYSSLLVIDKNIN